MRASAGPVSLRRLVLLAMTLFPAAAVLGQAWPTKPVRIIAPFAPGGSADTLGRLISLKLSDAFKQSFVIENRAGAGGTVGADLVAKAVPDGYLLVISGVASHVIGPALSKSIPFDPIRDFSHIALIGGPPIALVINPSVPAQTLKEFVAFVKGGASPLPYASPGAGTQGHLIGELLQQAAGIRMTHVSYKGAGLAVGDLAANHLQAGSFTLNTASGQLRAGRIRALAFTSQSRIADYPEVPTFRELGYPQLVATTWFSLSGPAHLPADIVLRLNTEVRRALQLADVRERFRAEGIESIDYDVAAFNRFVAEETARWAPIVRASGARAD